MKKLNLFGPVYNSSWDDCVTAKQVADFLSTLNDTEEFEVYINSPGGSVFEGIAIYNLLSEYSSRSTVKIIGEASSIASVIACAGGKVLIAETAMMLIHNPWTFSIVDEDYMKKLNKTLSTIKSQILKVYSRKTEMGNEEISKIMSESEYHSADDCVKLKLADEVYVPSDEDVSVIAESEKVKNELVRKYMILNFNPIDNKQKENEKMTIEELKAQVNNLEQQLNAKDKELFEAKSQFGNEVQELKAEVAKLNDFKAKAEQEIKNKEQALWLAEEKAFCEQLLAEKKLSPAEYKGNANENETPAKVVKLLKLRNLDEELYKAERLELSSRPSVQSLTQGLPNDESSNSDLVAYMEELNKQRGK